MEPIITSKLQRARSHEAQSQRRRLQVSTSSRREDAKEQWTQQSRSYGRIQSGRRTVAELWWHCRLDDEIGSRGTPAKAGCFQGRCNRVLASRSWRRSRWGRAYLGAVPPTCRRRILNLWVEQDGFSPTLSAGGPCARADYSARWQDRRMPCGQDLSAHLAPTRGSTCPWLVVSEVGAFRACGNSMVSRQSRRLQGECLVKGGLAFAFDCGVIKYIMSRRWR